MCQPGRPHDPPGRVRRTLSPGGGMFRSLLLPLFPLPGLPGSQPPGGQAEARPVLVLRQRGQPRDARLGGGHQAQADPARGGSDSLHSSGAPASDGVGTPL